MKIHDKNKRTVVNSPQLSTIAITHNLILSIFKTAKFVSISSFSILPFLWTNGLCHNCRIIKNKRISKNELRKVHRHTTAHQHTPSNIRRSGNKDFCQQSTSIAVHQLTNDFFFDHQEVLTRLFFLVQG